MHANAIALINGTWRYVSALEERVEHRATERTVTAFTQDGYHRNGLRPQDVRRFTDGYDDRIVVPAIKPTLDRVVTEAYEIQSTWETASNYTMYRIHPGTYRVTWQTIRHRDWTPDMQGDGRDPYWARVEMKATKLYSYWVNRVFAESSSHREEHNEETTFVTHTYAYDARPDKAGYELVKDLEGEISPAARLAELEAAAADDATWEALSAGRVCELEILRELAESGQL